MLKLLLLAAIISINVVAFSISFNAASKTRFQLGMAQDSPKFVSVLVPLGEGYKPYECKFRPLFENSMFYVTSYEVPFGLNIEKPPKGFPAPMVSKDSKGGLLKGDVLRATTCWSQGFSAAGVTSDIAQFAGNIRWRKSIFDVTGAPWDQTIDALLSNTEERDKIVTLVFERDLGDAPVAPVEPA